jgi:hypothetical protein
MSKKPSPARKEAPKKPAPAPASGGGFLGAVERIGNKVPHPAIIFFWLIGIVIALSALFGMLGTTVTFEGYDQSLGTTVEQTVAVRNLLSPDGIRFMFTTPVANFLGFTGVGVILVAMIGVGLADRRAGAQAGGKRASGSVHLHHRVRGGDVVDRGGCGLSGAGAVGGGRVSLDGAAPAGRSGRGVLGRCGGVSGQRVRHADRCAAGRGDE